MMRTNAFSPRCIAILLTIGGLYLTSPNVFAQHTYYISNSSGSDANSAAQAQSKSTPWGHLPGMPSCTSNCALYSPVAGDQFILKGGDTWTNGDLGVNWTWNGTSGAHIYIGVDQSWFTGSSWARPIFTCGSVACAGTDVQNSVQIWIAGSYVTIDNIELTGLRQTAATGPVSSIVTFSDHTEIENCYIHGWSRDPGLSDNGSTFGIISNISNGEAQVAGGKVHDNVIDGADTTQDMFNGIEFGDSVYHNVIRYVVSGLLGDFNNVYGNLIEDNVTSYAGDHSNLMFVFGPFNGSTNVWAYNNVVRHVGLAPGSEIFWINGNGGCSGCASYIYNNVVYDAGRGIDIGSHPGTGSTGTYYVYNNTVESDGDHCIGNSQAQSGVSITNYANNLCINSSAPCDSTGTTCINRGGNLSLTTDQATAAGYTSSQIYVYSPTTSNGPTVGIGNSLAYLCSGNVAMLCSDTTYPEYDSTNRVVVLRTVNTRPSSGSWDAGAYEFLPAGCIVTPTSIGPFTAGQAVSQQFTALGCNTSTFTITSGSLSGSGLVLSSGGVLSGIAQPGLFSFTVAYSTATDLLSVLVNTAPVVQPPSSVTLNVR